MTNVLCCRALMLACVLFGSCHTALHAQNYTSYFTGSLTDRVSTPEGGTCLMGGATENDNAMRWFLRRADGGDVLVIRASGSDGYNSYMHSELGISINSVESIVFHNRDASFENYIIDRIDKAEAIWIAGGDQWNYVNYWRDSPVATAINRAIAERHVAIGGTSAGMAVLGGAYFSAQNGTVTSAQALANPYDVRVSVSRQPFINVPYMANVITDTHYDDPDRRGRHLTFLARAYQDSGLPYFGIACDEYTAVCIDENGKAAVFGGYPDFDDNAYFIRPNCALDNNQPEVCAGGQPLSWNHGGQAVSVYHIKGTPTGLYTFDLANWLQGQGGDWAYWSANNGSFNATPGQPLDCQMVGLADATGSSLLQMYLFPNPAAAATVTLRCGNEQELDLWLLDVYGRRVGSWNNTHDGENLSIGHLPPGTYWLMGQSASGQRGVASLLIR